MDPVFLILISICIVLLASNVFKIYETCVFYWKLSKIPGPPGLPFIGNSLKLLKMSPPDRVKWLIEQDKKFNGIFKTYVGGMIMVRLRKPSYVEQLLPSTVNITKSTMYKYIEPWLGQGLLISTGERWVHHRKLITPAFHFGILEQYAPVMFDKANLLVERLEKAAKEKAGQPFDIFPYVTMCTLDIIGETAMGINMHAQSKTEHQYAKHIRTFSDILMDQFMRPWTLIDFTYYYRKEGKEFRETIRQMHEFTDKVIQSRKLARAQNKSQEKKDEEYDDLGQRKRKAFLDLLLDANESAENPLTDKEVQENVTTFMFAGHDTTSAAVSWVLFCLGNDLEIQEKLHKELDDVFGGSTETATLKQISELKYLERVFKEGLRLYPSAPEFSRLLQTKLVVDGYEIPAGVTLSLSAFLTHRDPDHWKDPLKFDPDRFLPENSKQRHPYAYFPFSAGPRNCIGQKFALLEAKIILCALLRKFKVNSVENHDTIKYYFALIIRPANGIQLYLTPRK